MQEIEKRQLFKIEKVDEERRIVGGWASIAVRKDGTLPEDTQGDVIDTPEAIRAWEDAFYKYALTSRAGDLQHEFFNVAQLVELTVFTPDKLEKMGASGALPVGAWVSFFFPPTTLGNEAWDGVKSGKYSQFSIVGSGDREPVANA